MRTFSLALAVFAIAIIIGAAAIATSLIHDQHINNIIWIVAAIASGAYLIGCIAMAVEITKDNKRF